MSQSVSVVQVALQGAPGVRGSLWFEGTGAPGTIPQAITNDQYLDNSTGNVWTYNGTAWTLTFQIIATQAAAAVAAVAAAAAALASASIYSSVAAGLAGTTNGKYFSVSPSAYPNGLLDLYLNSSGVAVYQASSLSASTISVPGSWKPGFVVTDSAGYKLIDISPTLINHPDTNSMRSALAALPEFIALGSWQGGFVVTDSAGYKLIDILPSKINHPDINAIRSQGATTAAAVASVTAGSTRLSSGFAFLGDSRMAQMYSSFGMEGTIKNRHHFFHKANYQLGNPMINELNLAVSGQRSDQYATQANLNAVIATTAKNLFVYGIQNDVIQNYTAAQIWAGYNGSPGMLSLVQQANAAGMRVILGLESGSTALTSAQIGQIAMYRQLCYELKEITPGLELIDIAAAVWGGSTSSAAISFLPGVLQVGDTTHPGTLGGAYVAPQFVEMAKRIGIVPVQRKVIAPWENGANGSMQLLQNNLFINTSGGTANTGVTGNVPADWVAGVLGTGLITGISYTPTLDGNGLEMGCGNDMTLTITSANDGTAEQDGASIYNPLNLAGLTGQYAAPQPGDIYQAGVEISVAAGSSGFLGAYVSGGPSFSDGTSVEIWDGYTANGYGAGPTTAYTDSLLTDKFVWPTGKTATSWNFSIKFLFAQGGGNATVTVRQAQLNRRYT